MSPTVFKKRNYRFFFFSREEKRIHIHVISPDGEAKFWIEPEIELVKKVGFNQKQIKLLEQIIKENRDEIRSSWRKHFGS
ncbi:MAG: DUF4160 domain-containing protein [Mariniphaga sp.]|nr:DUF4160 domain-containing protein [Mariniphaga sp.]